jgi:hypothetical protein
MLFAFALTHACPHPVEGSAPSALDVERSVLHDAERAWWLTEAHKAIAAGNDSDAARAIVWGLPVAANDFRPLADEIIRRGDPFALHSLATAQNRNVPDDLAAAAARQIELNQIERRFDSAGLRRTERSREGVDLEDGRAIFAGWKTAA